MNDLARVEGEQQGMLCVVRVHGEIDLSNAHEVSSAIGSAMGQEARGLVVDLSDITYLDSAGVALLLGWRSGCGLGDGSCTSWCLADLPFAGSSISRVCRGSFPSMLDWKTRWRDALVGCPTISRDRTARAVAAR